MRSTAATLSARNSCLRAAAARETSAARAAALLKALASFRVRAYKLFGKHLDAGAQARDLREGPPAPIAVGTPARLALHLSSGDLSLTHSAGVLVVLDAHPDVKAYTLLSHPNTRDDAAALIGAHLLPRAREGRLRLVLY